jgi:hypothetical protein
MKRRSPGLVPLQELAADPRRGAEVRMETRIARVWPLLVGPVLVRHTRLLRVRQRTLVLGCWKTEVMTSLRQSAEATWPQVQARLERLLGLKLQRLEIVPCDPPEPAQEHRPPGDPLEAVLRKYRSLRKQGWTRSPK